MSGVKWGKTRRSYQRVTYHYKRKRFFIISRDDAGKPVRRGYWKVQEHLNGEVTWQCSRCKSVFCREVFCPKCHSENKKTSHDPVWVDEIEAFDAMMND